MSVSDGSDAWKALWKHAMRALASLRPVMQPAWTFGGGTAMRLFYGHRVSMDVDIFLTDPYALTGLSPRLNDVTDEMTSDYTEQSNHLKLRFDEGEVDFIIGTRLLRDVPLERRSIEGDLADVEQPLEIVAKKCFYRAAQFTVRDVFDFAALLERDRAGVERHADVFFAHEALLARLDAFATASGLHDRYVAGMDAIDATGEFVSLKDRALADVRAFAERYRRTGGT